MWKLTLHQMRASTGRLLAAGIAIMLGTAFVASSLLVAATVERTTYNSVSAAYADADLVAQTYATDKDFAAVGRVAGVEAVHSLATVRAEFSSERRGEFVNLGATAPSASLEPGKLASGQFPTADGDVALTSTLARRLQVEVGDDLTAVLRYWIGDGAADSEKSMSTELTVVGILDEPDAFLFNSASALTTPRTLSPMLEADSAGESPLSTLTFALADGADVEQVRIAVNNVLGEETRVLTVAEEAEQTIAELTGNRAMMTTLLLGFVTVALAVAALVITNTFQVLVAQRTRTLALLRCIGAAKAQVRRSVLLEAALLGLVASIAGLVLGTALVAVGLQILTEANLKVPIAAGVVLTPAVVTAPLITGVAVTMLAALVPARMATRVTPLAALRPLDGSIHAGQSRLRAVLTAVLLVGGFTMLAAAVAITRIATGGENTDTVLLMALAVGLIGGIVSLVGVLVGSVYLVPRLIRLVGLTVNRGVANKIAIANAVRNPKRTASTASALLIGVALVTMMSTGAMTARTALTDTLDSRFPVDVSVSTADSLSDVQISAVQAVPGVRNSVLLTTVEIEAIGPVDQPIYFTGAAVSEGELGNVLRDPEAAQPDSGTIVLPHSLAASWNIKDGDTLTLARSGESAQGTLKLKADVTNLDGSIVILDPKVLATLGEAPPASMLWAKFGETVNERDAVRTIQATLADLSETVEGLPAPEVSGAAVERSGYMQVVDTLLAIVIGLLGVSVVIALVGVANTLSLSVIERRRESAMLRALGLTKSQLRGMLAIEGVLIAGAGALIGSAAGLAYGWAGSSVVLSPFGAVPLAVPWRALALVALVALVAGLLASVLPARSAVRTSPIAALNVD